MITLDYSNMMSVVQGGLTDAELLGAGAAFVAARAATTARHQRGELGFFDLPTDERLAQQSLDFARQAHARRFTDVVVLGIGGSALGPVALRTALRPSGWNGLDSAARGDLPRLLVLDNVDPVTIAALLQRVSLPSTLFLVISKSGGTAETMAQYLIIRARLVDAGLPLKEHLAFVTDPVRGALRPIAAAEGIPALEIPANVGGRFSVLSPVGMLPAALVGIDIRDVLRGAEAMRLRCEADDMTENPAGLFATVQWLYDRERGRRIHVLMPYSDQLRDFAAWFVQLWAESLGKIRPDGESVGPTPVAALGATDQHSQVQLFMEGPQDKTVTFVRVAKESEPLIIPVMHPDVPDLSYLGGKRLGELLSFEQRATAGALARRGRPNMTLELDDVDAWHVGGLIMLLEIATAYAGELYGVDAFDQPGVELGKRFTYAMMGRPGFDDAREEWEKLPPSDPQYRV